MPKGRHAFLAGPDHFSGYTSQQSEVISLTQLLRLDALSRAQLQEMDGALASSRALLNAGRSLGDEPLLGSQQARNQASFASLRVVERTLAQGQPTAPALATLQQLFEDEDRQPCLLVGARGHRAFSDEVMQTLRRGKRLDFLTGQAGRITAWPPTRQEFDFVLSASLQDQRAVLLEYETAVVESVKLPAAQQVSRVAALRGRKFPMIVAWLAWNPSGQAAGDLHTRAELRCTIVALAVERYRLQHGRWPQSLSALAPSPLLGIPIDPYDGQPLRYRQLADGAVVYCVGPDGKDDGGGQLDHLPPVRPRVRGVDVGVRLWDVAQRGKAAPAKAAPVKSSRGGPPDVRPPG
jgi:hypothetical protein